MKVYEVFGCVLRGACLSLSVASLVSFAAPVADDITCERFPDADSVTVDEIEKVKYNPDGTYEQTDECWTKILTEKGRRSESVVTLGYSKRYGEAAILYVGAVGTNGVERKIDVSRTTKESTDNSSMAINIYDPLDRTITCSVPGLQIGETLHVKTMRKATKARCVDKWADLSVMEWSHPIVRSTYEVTAPAARPLKKIAIRHPLGNVITSEKKLADGSTVHTFTATNSAQVFPEPDMPPLYTQVQNIRVSTSESWPEISKWYWELSVPHIAKTNAAMAAAVGKLTGDGKVALRDEDKIRLIFRFVSQEVRYMGLTMEDTSPGYAPHDVDVTFNNRYGVCRDKAGLLVAMLRLAGIKAFPVLIHVGAKLDPEVPQPFFNHAIVAVDRGNRDYLLMDPTNENTKDLFPSYLCNNSYIVARPEGEVLMTSPVTPPGENALDIVSSGRLSRDGSMFFECDISMKGINDTAYRGVLVKRTGDERVKTFERILKSVSPGAELVKCEITPKDLRDTTIQMSVKLAARFPEMVIRGDTREELSVPMLSKSLGIANWLLTGSTSLEKRRFTLSIDTTACVREHLTLDLGDSMGAVADLPASVKTSGGYDYHRNFSVVNGHLSMDRSLKVSKVEFSPEAYLKLREDIKRVEAAERRKPVFFRDFTRDANVRRRLDSAETTLVSDREWVTTNVDVTEVLTYKGKKDVAEIKIPFHPSWKSIELVYATVSNRNGKVMSVSPKEINYLDCGWASSAPRYPAGKIMVVNLPSVEIGSVVSVKTVVTVTNAPAPFYSRVYFDTFQPVDRLVRRIDGFTYDGRPARLPDEPSQPDGRLWRNCRAFTRGNWEAVAENLAAACDVEPIKTDLIKDVSDIASVRDWMTKNVRIVGPSLYELPIELQLTDPQVVLMERYATRLDYIRTLCAILRGAGYEADVVFAASNARDPVEVRKDDMTDHPNIRAFATSLCRVRFREGGFLCFGGEEREIFIGTENEYTPIGATGYDNCDYFDPATVCFGTVRNSEDRYAARETECDEFIVRENGAVDLVVSNFSYGAEVGGFRKRFAEILPENRSRFYQSLLGSIAQAASATSDLVTDTSSYPAVTSFSCFIPDFAAVSGDSISIVLPSFEEALPNLTGVARETPVAIGGSKPQGERVVIRFPEGYTEVEHLPQSFVFDRDGFVQHAKVTHAVANGVLSVTIDREIGVPTTLVAPPEAAEFIKECRRRSSSRSNRTITVRKRNNDGAR